MRIPIPGNRTIIGALGALAFGLLATADLSADEGVKSLHLLGKRGPLAGLIPKPGWYATNDGYYYQADSSKLVPIGGRVNQGVSVGP